MGSSHNTTTQVSGPNNPVLTGTLNKLLGPGNGVQGVFDKGPQVFNQSLFAGPGATTNAAQQATLQAAGNPAYASGVNAALGANNSLITGGGLTPGQTGAIGTAQDVAGQFGNLASGATAPSLTEQTLLDVAKGNRFGLDDPGYRRIRDNIANDVLTRTNSAFNNSGLFGSSANQEAAAEGLGNALASLDYGNFQNDQARQERALQAIEGQRQQGTANEFNALTGQLGASGQAFNQGQAGVGNQMAAFGNLPGLFSSLLAPATAQGAVGAAQDQATQGALSGQADLFDRTHNAGLHNLQQLIPLLTGATPAAGTTTTQSTPAPNPFLSGLGLLATFL